MTMLIITVLILCCVAIPYVLFCTPLVKGTSLWKRAQRKRIEEEAGRAAVRLMPRTVLVDEQLYIRFCNHYDRKVTLKSVTARYLGLLTGGQLEHNMLKTSIVLDQRNQTFLDPEHPKIHGFDVRFETFIGAKRFSIKASYSYMVKGNIPDIPTGQTIIDIKKNPDCYLVVKLLEIQEKDGEGWMIDQR